MTKKFPGYPMHLSVGLEERNGEVHGRNPKDMTKEELNALGHHKQSTLSVIRAACIDCSNTHNEVRKCTSIKCILWPYRMGSNPFSDRTVSPAALEALARYRDSKQNQEN